MSLQLGHCPRRTVATGLERRRRKAVGGWSPPPLTGSQLLRSSSRILALTGIATSTGPSLRGQVLRRQGPVGLRIVGYRRLIKRAGPKAAARRRPGAARRAVPARAAPQLLDDTSNYRTASSPTSASLDHTAAMGSQPDPDATAARHWQLDNSPVVRHAGDSSAAGLLSA